VARNILHAGDLGRAGSERESLVKRPKYLGARPRPGSKGKLRRSDRNSDRLLSQPGPRIITRFALGDREPLEDQQKGHDQLEHSSGRDEDEAQSRRRGRRWQCLAARTFLDLTSRIDDRGSSVTIR